MIVANSLGEGRVFYSPDPLEFHPGSPDIYKGFLNFSGVTRILIQPDDPSIRVFRLPTATEETVYVFFNESKEEKRVALVIGTETITLSIGAGKPGLIKTMSSGEVSALESQGESTIGTTALMDTDCHVMIASLDDQGIDESKSLMVLPIEPGHVRIATRIDWKNPVVGVGEMRSGKWHRLDSIEAKLSDGYLDFHINHLQSLNVLLIAEEDWLDKLAENL